MKLKKACIKLMKRGMTPGELEGHALRMGMSETEAAKLKVKALKWRRKHGIDTNRTGEKLRH